MAQTIRYFYTSHVGRVRKENQDNFFCNGVFLPHRNHGTDDILEGRVTTDKDPVFAIFDGMGGEECGEMAAYLAAKEMAEFPFGKGMEKDFFDFCKIANRRICDYTKEENISSMGTTAAIMKFTKEDCGICNIGDSKIFLLSEGMLNQLSMDHVGIAVFGKKPPLTQNLGIPEDEMLIDPYAAIGSYRPGDVYLICSDGVTDMLTVERIQEILTKDSGHDAARQLLSEALENGGKDNTSFILLYVEKKKTVFEKLKEVRLWQQKK